MMRCRIHPDYDGSHKPTGFPCAQCSMVYVTAESERYDRLERQPEGEADQAASPKVLRATAGRT